MSRKKGHRKGSGRRGQSGGQARNIQRKNDVLGVLMAGALILVVVGVLAVLILL